MGTSVYKIPPLMTAIKGRVEGNDPPFSLFEKQIPREATAWSLLLSAERVAMREHQVGLIKGQMARLKAY